MHYNSPHLAEGEGAVTTWGSQAEDKYPVQAGEVRVTLAALPLHISGGQIEALTVSAQHKGHYGIHKA